MSARKLRWRPEGIYLTEADAWYQYLIDHGSATPAGIKVNLILTTKEELIKRVVPRYAGMYRKDEAALLKRCENMLIELDITRKMAKKRSLRADKFRNGNPYRRCIFWLHQIFKKIIYNDPL